MLAKEEIREKELVELELKEEIETLKEEIQKGGAELKGEKEQKKKNLSQINQLQKSVKELTSELTRVQQSSDRNNSQIKEKSDELKDVINQLR